MKVLAKTVGMTLLCTSGDFLDEYAYRLVEYSSQVRDWNNRNLLEIKCFVDDKVSDEELKELGAEEFAKKYDINAQKVEEKKPEEKVEEKSEEKAEDDFEERKPRKKSRRN